MTFRRALFAPAAIALMAAWAAHADVWIPRTADEHERAADEYESKAREWRQVASSHREMAAEYKKQGEGLKPGFARVHCAALAQDADRLAADAEEFAAYHHSKAQELRRK